jgi:putative FmdB family regulatory protein
VETQKIFLAPICLGVGLMPVYEYLCKNCKTDFEKLVFGYSPVVNCPECGGNNLEKKMSLFSSKSGDALDPASPGSGCGSCSSRNCGSCRG